MNNALWLETAKNLYNLQLQRRSIEKQEELLAAQLKELSGNEEKQVDGIKYSYSLRIGSVDYAKIPELTGVDLNKYRKEPVKSWKLSIEAIV